MIRKPQQKPKTKAYSITNYALAATVFFEHKNEEMPKKAIYGISLLPEKAQKIIWKLIVLEKPNFYGLLKIFFYFYN